MPSRTMSARVTSAKYSGTVNGKSKKIWLRSRETAANWRLRRATARWSPPPPPKSEPPFAGAACMAARPKIELLRSFEDSPKRRQERLAIHVCREEAQRHSVLHQGLHVAAHQVDDGRGQRVGVEAVDLSAQPKVDEGQPTPRVDQQVAWETGRRGCLLSGVGAADSLAGEDVLRASLLCACSPG
eukprot:scaffold2872_cov112-Isochrysis_galbana.AAC.1